CPMFHTKILCIYLIWIAQVAILSPQMTIIGDPMKQAWNWNMHIGHAELKNSVLQKGWKAIKGNIRQYWGYSTRDKMHIMRLKDEDELEKSNDRRFAYGQKNFKRSEQMHIFVVKQPRDSGRLSLSQE
ncbi:hypothetical protein ACJX0J_032016, partial [Zea mays]